MRGRAAALQTTVDRETGVARLSGPALRAFGKIADAWELSVSERRTLLGSIPASTYHKYIREADTARLSADTLERISHVLGIFKSLNILLPRREAADAWIRRSNEAPLFNGRSALELLMSGRFEDLIAVRHYLDGERGW